MRLYFLVKWFLFWLSGAPLSPSSPGHTPLRVHLRAQHFPTFWHHEVLLSQSWNQPFLQRALGFCLLLLLLFCFIFVFENGIRSQDSGAWCAHYYWGFRFLRSSHLPKQENICIRILMHEYLQIFLDVPISIILSETWVPTDVSTSNALLPCGWF